jgi:hypothetical protein
MQETIEPEAIRPGIAARENGRIAGQAEPDLGPADFSQDPRRVASGTDTSRAFWPRAVVVAIFQ